MGSVRIKGIEKDNGNHENPHEAIKAYCWVDEADNKSGKTDRPTMVSWMEKGNSAYVKDSYGNKAFCYVRISVHNTKFLQTKADNTYTDNLLKLPEC
ncbi:hypothetical protein A2274_00275 [candidate division WWE3 bacterium RIFOXYA12_FULL_43_11]|uniref:DUF3892 domain-containing protein n=2 Tax=Katanobacteria TaxID=422282 RepID=A0A0G0VU68_UNCKA|nr:MAG: hypothetical protein UR43_C0017G0011 [candidate division TM6 bacterium GW2011_GWF2_33_332]KKS03222.1 MAG: hypothetical protein UU55_C0004G0011 [candidate division WWE3 bacterium GW2011_GWC2_41_23]OGC59197.1 MAG: hypothetical protein A2245_00340 [candidate division WWE3 bacterium RIFOXYA2_FULL_43_12]OGC65536.1 MAG: hypothetical protein A2274_00275 [candidate division WWE3 bacterium RIFOXYA12_FULL_43_11]HBY09777.1 DUF3892 domain-containing protein [candidate division WWE3 bacterium]HLD90